MAERLVDFACSDATMDWHPIDDVVMGGVSQSALQPYSRGVACFGGVMSLEHGGGFASVRTEPRQWNTAGANAFVVRCRGDGRHYKFTARTDDGFDGDPEVAAWVNTGATETVFIVVDGYYFSREVSNGATGSGPFNLEYRLQ